jgi:hypothetical protein
MDIGMVVGVVKLGCVRLLAVWRIEDWTMLFATEMIHGDFLTSVNLFTHHFSRSMSTVNINYLFHNSNATTSTKGRMYVCRLRKM